jgi:L-fuculose-phosphate aldolase
VTGEGMANPATRFHLWVYEARPDVNSIVHTHSPWASALAAAREPLVISQMDMTPLHDDCAFLGEWPGVPIADYEGVVISKALGSKRAIILAHHGYLTAGKTIEEATYLSVYLERAARMQIRARAFGPLTPVDDGLAREAHDYLLQPSIVNSTFEYWCRQTRGAPQPLSVA